MKVAAAAKSDIGLVREGNEDAYLTEDPLFVVADGMGGHLAGEVASEIAIEVIAEGWRSAHDPTGVAELIERANAAIWDRASSDSSLSGMGTTCTAIVVDDHQAHVAHVGDSRAYLLRDDEMVQVTDDHTVVARMVSEGRIEPDEAERHPHRNVLTRALGVDPDVEVDSRTVELRVGDRLLVCSDGLTGMVGAGEIRTILEAHDDPDQVAAELITRANAAGGEDNITVIVVDVVSDEPASPRPPPPEPDVDGRADLRVATTPDVAPRRRRTGRRLAIVLLVLLVVGVAGAVWARALLRDSWYVGVNTEGVVTIYRGIPNEIAGFSLKEEVETTSLELDDLPEFRRSDVRQGIEVDSEAQARETLDNLEREARDEDLSGGARDRRSD